MSVCLSVLCSLCTATVLSKSAQNLACGILIPYRWPPGVASATLAHGLHSRMPELAGATDRVSSMVKFRTARGMTKWSASLHISEN